MDISLLLKTVGVGIIVAVSSQILQKTGKDEQAMLVSIVGAVIVIVMLIGEIEALFDTVRTVFEL